MEGNIYRVPVFEKPITIDLSWPSLSPHYSFQSSGGKNYLWAEQDTSLSLLVSLSRGWIGHLSSSLSLISRSPSWWSIFLIPEITSAWPPSMWSAWTPLLTTSKTRLNHTRAAAATDETNVATTYLQLLEKGWRCWDVWVDHHWMVANLSISMKVFVVCLGKNSRILLRT